MPITYISHTAKFSRIYVTMCKCLGHINFVSKILLLKYVKKIHNPAQVYLNGTEGPTPEHVVVA